MTDWWTANRVPAAGCCRCAGGRESAPGPAGRRAHAPPSFLNTCRYSWKMYRRHQVEPSAITDPFHRPPFHINVRNRSATPADTNQGERARKSRSNGVGSDGVLNDEESSMQIQVYSDNRIENSSKLVE